MLQQKRSGEIVLGWFFFFGGGGVSICQKRILAEITELVCLGTKPLAHGNIY